MIRNTINTKTSLRVNQAFAGESIEKSIARMINNGEQWEANTILERVYTERKDGVLPETNIRSDAFEMAIQAVNQKIENHIKERTKRHFPEEPQGQQSTDNKVE